MVKYYIADVIELNYLNWTEDYEPVLAQIITFAVQKGDLI